MVVPGRGYTCGCGRGDSVEEKQQEYLHGNCSYVTLVCFATDCAKTPERLRKLHICCYNLPKQQSFAPGFLLWAKKAWSGVRDSGNGVLGMDSGNSIIMGMGVYVAYSTAHEISLQHC